MHSYTLAPEGASEKRSVLRCVPPQLVTTSLLDAGGPVFGTLSNLCNFGACVTTDHLVAVGRSVGVLIAFDFLPRMFEARGRVMWSRPTSHAAAKPCYDHGLRFTGLGESERETLRRVLGSPEFQEGHASHRGTSTFDDFVRELRPELEALGRKFFPDDREH
jgi:hypothetical protein